MTASTKDILFLHFIVFLWGFTAVIGLLIDLPAIEVVLYRILISIAGLGGVLWFIGIPLKGFDQRDLIQIVVTGVFFGLHWIFFFLSARYSNVSVCLIGMATTPIWSSLLEPLILKKRFSIYQILLGLLSLVGVIIIYASNESLGYGLMLAILAALLGAVFTISNAQLVRKNNHFKIMFYEMIAGFMTTLLLLPLGKLIYQLDYLKSFPSNMDWFYLVVLAMVCTVFAYSYSIKLMKRITPFTVNLTVNLEPVYGIAVAFMVFGEKELLGKSFYLGSAIILSSVLIDVVIKRRTSKSLTR